MSTASPADVFQAIATPIRRDIIRRLALSGDQSISLIAKNYEISRQGITRHIQVLVQSGVITIQKTGREQICHLNVVALKEVSEWLSFYEALWDNKLNALDDYLAQQTETGLNERE
ncbi:MAG: helix-turn-helix domain-containing protein [Chloroflexota bacterium]